MFALLTHFQILSRVSRKRLSSDGLLVQVDLAYVSSHPKGSEAAASGAADPFTTAHQAKIWTLEPSAASARSPRHDQRLVHHARRTARDLRLQAGPRARGKMGKLDRENQHRQALISLQNLGRLPAAFAQVVKSVPALPLALVREDSLPAGHDNEAGHKFWPSAGHRCTPWRTPSSPPRRRPGQRTGHAPPNGDGRKVRLRDVRLEDLPGRARGPGWTAPGRAWNSSTGCGQSPRQRRRRVSRGAGLCRRCGGPKRGRGARVSAPIADCVDCGDPICDRHAVQAPADNGYRCTKCERARKKAPAP